jgi:hypothetical protein
MEIQLQDTFVATLTMANGDEKSRTLEAVNVFVHLPH